MGGLGDPREVLMGLESKPGCPASDPLTVTRGPADGALSGSREEHGEAL